MFNVKKFLVLFLTLFITSSGVFALIVTDTVGEDVAIIDDILDYGNNSTYDPTSGCFRFSPSAAIQIVGRGFGDSIGKLVINGVRANTYIHSWEDTRIILIVPEESVNGNADHYSVSNGTTIINSGKLYIRTSGEEAGAPVNVDISWPDLTPDLDENMKIAENSLNGACIGVAKGHISLQGSDNYIYVNGGTDTIVIYALPGAGVQSPPTPVGRIYLPHKINGGRVYTHSPSSGVYNDYLLLSGDFGLRIYSCNDLKNGIINKYIAVGGGSFFDVSVRDVSWQGIDTPVIALSEYVPYKGDGTAGYIPEHAVPVYKFYPETMEIEKFANFTRTFVNSSGNPLKMRQFGVAIDPEFVRIFVVRGHYPSYQVDLPTQAFIDEIMFDPANPDQFTVNTKAYAPVNFFLGGWCPISLDVSDITGELMLWVGFGGNRKTWVFGGFTNEALRNYLIKDPSTNDLISIENSTEQKVVIDNSNFAKSMMFCLVNENVLAFVDGTNDRQYNVGFLNPSSLPDGIVGDQSNTSLCPDWATGVTGYGTSPSGDIGEIVVSDEWGGINFYDYNTNNNTLTFNDQKHTNFGGWVERLHLVKEGDSASPGNRIYVAGRGAGLWSVSLDDPRDNTKWNKTTWNIGTVPPENWRDDYPNNMPQPYPVGNMCTKRYSSEDPVTYIVARTHNKAFAWGAEIRAVLYSLNDNPENNAIELLGESDFSVYRGATDPGNIEGDVIWPDIKDPATGDIITRDLVFMTHSESGVGTYLVDRVNNNIHHVTSANPIPIDGDDNATTIRFSENRKQLLVGIDKGSCSGGGLFLYDVTFPQGNPPSVGNTNNAIDFLNQKVLFPDIECKPFTYPPAGADLVYMDFVDDPDDSLARIAVATPGGLGIFPISAFDENKSWNDVVVNTDDETQWGDGFDNVFSYVCFDKSNPEIVYAIGTKRIWRLRTGDVNNLNDVTVEGSYPIAEGRFTAAADIGGYALSPWKTPSGEIIHNPDSMTLHLPTSIVAIDNVAYVSTWTGKIHKLVYDPVE